MPCSRRRPRVPGAPTVLVLTALAATAATTSRAEVVVLKNGGVFTGVYDRDNTVAFVFDDLRRIVFGQTKIERIDPDPPNERQAFERFKLEQPLAVHGGTMPSHALRVRATPWDEFGRREFEYSTLSGTKLQPHKMRQAINEIGPDVVKFRGIDGFWLGQLDTDQVPRDVVLGLLGRVDQKNQNERLRVGRFLIQVGWYDEALAELDRLSKDFPAMSRTIDQVRGAVRDLKAEEAMRDADLGRRAGQPRGAEAALVVLDRDALSRPVLERVDELLAAIRAEKADAAELASDLQRSLDTATPGVRELLAGPALEVLQALNEVPDAAIDRLAPVRDASPDATPAARLASILSTWIGGPDLTTNDPDRAATLWKARDLIAVYLAAPAADDRDALVAELSALMLPDADGNTATFGPALAAPIVARLFPPRGGDTDRPGVPLIRRVLDDPNARPTDYHVLLPPEYHPMRSYPAIVALNDGRGPESALDWWGPEAARHGYVVIAPDYLSDEGGSVDYRYTPDEHAAVLLALRDARKRFAIDADRVFLGGTMIGGNAAWDVGLAHFDAFAGVVTVAGLPAKYVAKTLDHADYVPLCIVIGDLATAATEAMVLDTAKSMIRKTWDVTYIEYFRRGLEPLPEAAPQVFEWMDVRRRAAHRKEFTVDACRTCDDRYYGLVIREFVPGRTPAASTVDPLGKNLDPATIEQKVSTLSNLLSLKVSGINALDVWLTPEYFKFDDRLQIRINGKRLYYDVVAPSLAAMLEDVRIRGDRGQLYWAKVPLGGRRPG